MADRDLLRRAGHRVKDNAREYVVTYIFLALSVLFVAYSGRPMTDIFYQLMSRLTRNLFIVLALIIPIVAGMGINFAITIGAMAAQIGLLLVINWGVSGVGGLLLAAAITMPLAAGFGFLIGSLLNKMKGQETIGSMILGFFANGAYQLLFLFLFGKMIPLNESVTIVGGTGVANTLNLTGSVGLLSALDNVWRVTFTQAFYGVTAIALIGSTVLLLLKKTPRAKAFVIMGMAAAFALIFQIPAVKTSLQNITIPVVTFGLIALLCLFNVVIMRTRLGQKFRAVGQSRVVANAAGINVNRVRIIAIMISTVLAGWGQIIFIQNLGTLQTYAAHEMVGLYAGAAILVGGASIDRATNGQAIIGCILFHTLFVVAQDAGSNLFGDPNIGEFFRVFLCYGVIALALVMYTWRGNAARKAAAREAARG
ncbi:MAG: ABC transporter permease [Candidatus Limiplasma sp.]|nr:ABC transporter permease [Candidatus Limiplasma sp.]MEA5145800.1 ABC transporter permease [Candidatus Limiplasma sp.]